jgi:hypothetical protein
MKQCPRCERKGEIMAFIEWVEFYIYHPHYFVARGLILLGLGLTTIGLLLSSISMRLYSVAAWLVKD